MGESPRSSGSPVKPAVGEDLVAAAMDGRGLVGDRVWAVRDVVGKFGSGETNRRLRRMPGLLDLAAHHEHDLVSVVSFMDGQPIKGDQPKIRDALNAHVGRQVTLAPQGDTSHFGDGPLRLVTTRSVAG